jgi:hypothetical protein
MSNLETARLEMSYGQRICKVDEHPDCSLVVGVVMIPDKIDNQGDYASADVIEKAAHGFLEESGRPGLMHKARLTKREACIVENQIVRSRGYRIDGVEVPLGSWVLAMRIYDPSIRDAVRRGLFRGFSIGANADFETISVDG